MTVVYCAFCTNKAGHVIERSGTPICDACIEIYEAGQSNPDGAIIEIREEEP